jgi:hypothetical protein
MNMKNLLAVCLFCGIAFPLSAQQPVALPPRPVNDAPANTAILKLLQVGMPESVVLDKIHAIPDKFDTSIDALVVLKQAGASETELSAILAKGGAASPEQPPAAVVPAAPVAASAASAPTLAETMKFIQDKLNDMGKMSYIEFNQYANGSTSTDSLTNETNNVVADAGQCRISYYRYATQNGNVSHKDNSTFSLRDVQEIVVKPEEQLETEWNAQKGSPDNIITSTSPPVTALIARGSSGTDYVFHFYDSNLADRIAKAMLHAVELCGGGQKSPEPF